MIVENDIDKFKFVRMFHVLNSRPIALCFIVLGGLEKARVVHVGFFNLDHNFLFFFFP